MFGIKRVVIPMGEPVKGADGREQFSVSCPHCGSTVWVKQSRIFKRMWKTDCPNCGRTSWGRMKVINIDDEVKEPVMDIDLLVAYLRDKAIDDIDPLLMEAADRLKELQEKHWSECWQIGVYSDTDEKAKRLVAATTMEPLTVDGVKDSAKAVKTIYTKSDLDNLSTDDGTVRYYTD